MTNEELKDKAIEELKDALYDMEELQQQREYFIRAYEGEPVDIDGKSLEDIDGRSQVVQTDVADTIEWVMPALMSIFFGGHNITELRPRGPEDEQAAKLMQEKVNYDITVGMDGFNLFYDWFKDGLMNKLGAVKYWWDEVETSKVEEYEGLTEEEYAAITSEDDFELDEEEKVIAAEATFDDNDIEITPEVVYYNIKGTRTTIESKPMAEALPPEEFIHNLTMKSIEDAEFVAHKKRVHKNELAKYPNIDASNVTAYVSDQASNILRDERFEDIGGINYLQEDEESDYVYIYECYMYDYDSNGNKLPKKVLVFGDDVLEVEDNTYGKPPFCILTAVRKQHRAVGYSLVEWVMQLQKLNTALTRAILDNIYYQNNGVEVINPYRLNMDDVLDNNHPGGKWRTSYDIDPARCIAPVPMNPLPPAAYQMLDTVQMWKENRTGITRYNQGLDSKSLNKTATGISQIMGAAQQRIELIARLFAETGVKDLFQAFVDMNLEYFDAETNIRLNDEWQEINPEMISGKYDLSIDVGVGTGSNEIKINQLIQMLDRAPMAAQAGVVTPENLYQSFAQIYELMGFKNTDKYVTDPAKAGGQLPPEIVQTMMQMLAQNGVNVDGLIQAAAQVVEQGAEGSQGQGGSVPQ
jgi:hypothetical protein